MLSQLRGLSQERTASRETPLLPPGHVTTPSRKTYHSRFSRISVSSSPRLKRKGFFFETIIASTISHHERPCVKIRTSPQVSSRPRVARPTARLIIVDNDLENKLNDEVFLITGCSAGLGVETARALAATSATLHLTARNLEAKEALGPELAASPKVHILKLNLNSLASVRECTREFLDVSSS